MGRLHEMLVYVARKTGWTLTEIKSLAPSELLDIYTELRRQEADEDYQNAYNFAALMATIVNCTPRRDRRVYRAEDFLKRKSPIRKPKETTSGLLATAKARGLKTPPLGGNDD